MELEEQRDARQPHNHTIAHKGGHAAAQGERVSINPDLRVIPNPEFVAWREDLKARGVA